MKTSKQVEQELEEEKARYEFLKNRKVELEKELKEIEQELRPYRHSSYRSGKIQYIQEYLRRVQLIEESESLPIPVKLSGAIDESYRILKVTPKRIYIRKLNKESATVSEEIYNKDGSGFQWFDIPETLKVWEEYLAKKDAV